MLFALSAEVDARFALIVEVGSNSDPCVPTLYGGIAVNTGCPLPQGLSLQIVEAFGLSRFTCHRLVGRCCSPSLFHALSLSSGRSQPSWVRARIMLPHASAASPRGRRGEVRTICPEWTSEHSTTDAKAIAETTLTTKPPRCSRAGAAGARTMIGSQVGTFTSMIFSWTSGICPYRIKLHNRSNAAKCSGCFEKDRA